MGFIIVTGATGGLGSAFTRLLVKMGHCVLLVGRSREALDQLCSELPPSLAYAVCADMNSWNPEEVIEEACAHFGSTPAGLIHCAGISARTSIERLRSRRVIDACFGINVIAAVELTAVCAPMLVGNKGYVIFVSSLAEFAGLRDYSIYSACKRAVRSFAESLDAEFATRGLRVLTVYPGEMKTQLQRNELDAECVAYGADGLYEGPFIEPAVVARAALDAMQARRRTVFAPRFGRIFSVLCRLAPGLVRVAIRDMKPGAA